MTFRILIMAIVILVIAPVVAQDAYAQDYSEFQGKEFELVQIPFNQAGLDSVFPAFDIFSCGDYFARALVRPDAMLMLYLKMPDSGNLGFMIFPTRKFVVEIDDSYKVPAFRLQLTDDCSLDYVKIRISRNEFDNSLCLPSPPKSVEPEEQKPKKNSGNTKT